MKNSLITTCVCHSFFLVFFCGTYTMAAWATANLPPDGKRLYNHRKRKNTPHKCWASIYIKKLFLVSTFGS